MKTKITMILLAVTMILVGVCTVSVLSKDTDAPVITVPKADITYAAGTDQSILLEGVTAYDIQDGDLSDKIRIYDIAVLEDGNRAQVIYAVYDESYNLGKNSMIINYIPAVKTPVDEETAEETAEETTEEVSWMTTEEDEADDERESENSEPETKDTEAEETEEDETNGTSPVIRLLENEVYIDEGGSFNSLGYVDTVTDDEDSREYLYRNIHVDGSYNVNQKGEYILTYYCVDSDGNESNKARLRLIVGWEENERDATGENR